MEVCEMPLKDWLSYYVKATSEVFKTVLSVTCDIARGVQHLKANTVGIAIKPTLHNKTMNGNSNVHRKVAV